MQIPRILPVLAAILIAAASAFAAEDLAALKSASRRRARPNHFGIAPSQNRRTIG